MKIREKAADLLHNTQQYIREFGWAQGNLEEGDTGKVCAMGGMVFGQGLFEVDNDSLSDLVCDHPDMIEACWLLVGQINPDIYRDTCVSPAIDIITSWNDTDGRTEQEVMDALAKAEKIARAGFDPDVGQPL